jgi:hypothetical protein
MKRVPLTLLALTGLLAFISVGYFLSLNDRGGRPTVAQATVSTPIALAGQMTEGLPGSAVDPEKPVVRSVMAERVGHLRGAIKRTAVLDDQTKTLMLQCVQSVDSLKGVKTPVDFNTLNEYLDKAVILPPGHAMRTRLQYRNMHLLDSNGRRLRLYIAPVTDEDGTGPKLVPRLFATDDENLALPLELPEELKGPDWLSAVDQFKSQGQLVSDEVSEDRRWDDKTNAHVIVRNGRIENLEIFFRGGELICARSEGRASALCQCL